MTTFLLFISRRGKYFSSIGFFFAPFLLFIYRGENIFSPYSLSPLRVRVRGIKKRGRIFYDRKKYK